MDKPHQVHYDCRLTFPFESGGWNSFDNAIVKPQVCTCTHARVASTTVDVHPGRHMRKKRKTKKERTNTTGPLDKRRACPRLIHVRGARTALSSYDKGPLLGALVQVLTKPCKRSSISDVSRSWPLLRAPRTPGLPNQTPYRNHRIMVRTLHASAAAAYIGFLVSFGFSLSARQPTT